MQSSSNAEEANVSLFYYFSFCSASTIILCVSQKSRLGSSLIICNFRWEQQCRIRQQSP